MKRNTLKKFFSIVLSIAILSGIGIPVYAVDNGKQEKSVTVSAQACSHDTMTFKGRVFKPQGGKLVECNWYVCNSCRANIYIPTTSATTLPLPENAIQSNEPGAPPALKSRAAVSCSHNWVSLGNVIHRSNATGKWALWKYSECSRCGETRLDFIAYLDGPVYT